jgi:L-ascorbate metabolism protein UlaG (beta-lactamase superfamily)
MTMPAATIERPATLPGAHWTGASRWDGKRFSNVYEAGTNSLLGALKWKLGARPEAWPTHRKNRAYPAPRDPDGQSAAVTFIGHATFLLQIGGLSIITDPVFARRASPIGFAGPKRVRAPGQPLEALPSIDLVLVSHNHYDHLDKETLRTLQERDAPRIMTGLGNGALLAGLGFRPVSELDWWQSDEMGGVRVTYVPAQHFSARGLTDRNRTLWGGFVIEGSGKTIYFAADTGFSPHFQEVAARFPKIDLALLPIGAYEPRWFMRTMHMNPADAVEAHRILNPRLSIGMHFGTFSGLTDEGIDQPITELEAAMRTRRLPRDSFITLDFGETRSF